MFWSNNNNAEKGRGTWATWRVLGGDFSCGDSMIRKMYTRDEAMTQNRKFLIGSKNTFARENKRVDKQSEREEDIYMGMKKYHLNH